MHTALKVADCVCLLPTLLRMPNILLHKCVRAAMGGSCNDYAAGGLEAVAPSSAAAAVARFEPRAAALLLEEEIREAVIGTAGAALGAPLSKYFAL